MTSFPWPFHHHRPRLALVVWVSRGRHRHHWRRHVYILEPGANTMSTSVTVGHVIDFSIQYVDTSGNPMLTPVTPDSPPVWADAPASPPVDTFTPSADGLTAVLTATAAGADTVSLTVIVGGVTYSASDIITINAAPQVLGGVQIVATVV